MDITDVIRRWQSGQSIRAIKRGTHYDRETISKYISLAISSGIRRDLLLSPEEIRAILPASPPASPVKREKTDILLMHIDEFITLTTDKHHPLKPKSAFDVLSERYEFKDLVSYTTFKRFARAYGIKKKTKDSGTTCRMEISPGSQIQVDYGKMGYIFDKASGRRRTVYAFIATLSHSRHKFVQFVYSQDQKSFAESHVQMFSFFQGVASTIRIDNLKSGVIKPDLYDPQLNRTYRDMAEHYDVFIDACRPGQPKDKPIVERDVQTVREWFRKELAVNPSVTLPELNGNVINWIRNDYGMRSHGTTKQKPYEVFLAVEQPALKPLPLEPFEASQWKEARVHPDHFIQVNGKAYSVPHAYVEKKVWVKVTSRMIHVYYDNELIKQHVIPKGYRQTDLNDFPENMAVMMDQGMPKHLINKAEQISPVFGELVERTLKPHAFINMRKAQSLLTIAGKYPPELVAAASTTALNNHSRINSAFFESVLEKLIDRINETNITMSEETLGMTRDMEYYMQ